MIKYFAQSCYALTPSLLIISSSNSLAKMCCTRKCVKTFYFIFFLMRQTLLIYQDEFKATVSQSD